MRVGFDTHVLQGNRSGTAVYVENLLSNLNGINDYQIIPIDMKLRLPRRNVLTKISNAALELLYTFFLSPVLCSKKHINICHYPANISPPISGMPKVVTILDMMFLRYPETYDPYYVLFAKVLYPLSARTADRIITISEFSKKDIIKFCKIPGDKITSIPLGVSDLYHPIAKNLVNEYIKDKYSFITQPYIIYTGEITPRKNLENLIKAFSLLHKQNNLKEYHLVLTGNRKEIHYFNKLVKWIEHEGLSSHIHWLDYVPLIDLVYLISASKLMTFVSLCEGFGLPILESMACGTPAITSNRSSMPEVGGDAVVYVNPENFEDIFIKMQQVLTNESLNNSLINKGLQRSKQFTWKNTANETIDVYKSLFSK